jgi:hypothetical protein
MTTLEASRAVQVVGLFYDTLEEDEKVAMVVELFIDLHSHDWFSPGFIAFFTSLSISQVEFALRTEENIFIPTRKDTSHFGYHLMYTTIKKFNSFSNEEKAWW